MNLTELVRYQAPCVDFTPGAAHPARVSIAGARWLGFELLPSKTPQIRIRDLLSLRAMNSFPDSLGWFVAVPEGGAEGGMLTMATEASDAPRERLWSQSFRASADGLTPVTLCWPMGRVDSQSRLDLVVQVPEDSTAPVLLVVSQLLKRTDFTSRIHGYGVEIGPGMTPQILPSENIDVIYVDEMTREAWQKTYGYKKEKWDEAAGKVPWDRFRSGGALELPVEEGSLDFVFGSHVFEHLMNPIQHLKNWLCKLRSGGQVHMIVPAADASVDYRQEPSALAQMQQEFEQGNYTIDVDRYARIVGPEAAPAALAERRSLHVHFYDPQNLTELLRFAERELGARSHVIHHRRNYREIFFTLEKA